MAQTSVLCYSRHWGECDYMRGMCRVKGAVFQRLMESFSHVVSPLVYERQLTDPAGIVTVTVLPNKTKHFKHHPYAFYATDVTFQQRNRPFGNHQASKRYFSAEHKLYGYNVEVSVFPNGLALGSSLHRLGSVSDLTIFRECFDWH